MATTPFTELDHRRIADAIAAAEARTSGEIFCIVSRQQEPVHEATLVWATATALALPLLAVFLGFDPSGLAPASGWEAGVGGVEPHRFATGYAILQFALFTLVAGLLALTPLGHAATPRPMKRARVHRQALEQFLAKGLHVTEARTGVLIFTSLADHIVEVVADEGIYRRVQPEIWGEAVAAMTEELKAGRPAEGFLRAIDRIGAVLAEHFPRGTLDRNELPDKLVEL